MNSITMKIPLEFIRSRVDLTWSDILYGLVQQLISPTLAIQLAGEHRNAKHSVAGREDELADLQSFESVIDAVRELSSESPRVSDSVMRKKWMYLSFAWVFENQSSFHDPLAIAEELYEEFDHPKEIASFVRYMPMQGPDLGTKAKNEARLIRNWESYLDSAHKLFGTCSGTGH